MLLFGTNYVVTAQSAGIQRIQVPEALTQVENAEPGCMCMPFFDYALAVYNPAAQHIGWAAFCPSHNSLTLFDPALDYQGTWTFLDMTYGLEGTVVWQTFDIAGWITATFAFADVP